MTTSWSEPLTRPEVMEALEALPIDLVLQPEHPVTGQPVTVGELHHRVGLGLASPSEAVVLLVMKGLPVRPGCRDVQVGIVELLAPETYLSDFGFAMVDVPPAVYPLYAADGLVWFEMDGVRSSGCRERVRSRAMGPREFSAWLWSPECRDGDARRFRVTVVDDVAGEVA